MKITVNIECTPEEARRFLGLPDLAPMQEAVVARLQERVLDAVDAAGGAAGPEALLKAWMPMATQAMATQAMATQAPEAMREAMARFLAAFGTPGAGPGGRGGGAPGPG